MTDKVNIDAVSRESLELNLGDNLGDDECDMATAFVNQVMRDEVMANDAGQALCDEDLMVELGHQSLGQTDDITGGLDLTLCENNSSVANRDICQVESLTAHRLRRESSVICDGQCDMDEAGTAPDQCVTDEELMTMDSSNIIPEAAMKCGILPIDSMEDDSLGQMSAEGLLQQPPPPQPQPSPESSAEKQQLCVGCKRPITERYLLKVMDQFWHEDCLKCSCCDCRLGEVGSTLFTKANLLLCRRDYLRLFGATGCCSVCSKIIPAFEMVMRAKGNVYHLECFACQQCNHRFCIGDRYYLYDNKILCEFDYEERLVFARLSHGYNPLSNIKRQGQSINGVPPSTNCRSSNLNGC